MGSISQDDCAVTTMEHVIVHVLSFIECFEKINSPLVANITLALAAIAGALVFDCLVTVLHVSYGWMIQQTCSANDSLHNSGKLTSRKASFDCKNFKENSPLRVKNYRMRILQKKLNGFAGNRPRHCHKLEKNSENERSAPSSSDLEKRMNSLETRMDEVASEIDQLQQRINALTYNSSHGEHCPFNQVL